MSFFKLVEPYQNPNAPSDDTLIEVVRTVIRREREHYALFRAARTTDEQYGQLNFLRGVQTLRAQLERQYNITIDFTDLYDIADQEMHGVSYARPRFNSGG